jgi:pyridoxal phosphate enzyme (YggS family)
MEKMVSIADNLSRLEERIALACARSGRKREEIRLMAVSKFHGKDEVDEAYKAGLRLFGENRVQEGIKKFENFRTSLPGTEVHMIGSLQRNKARTAAGFFDCVQSVDRESLLAELGRLCGGRSKPLTVLLELHTGEESKRGFPDDDSVLRAAEIALSFPGLKPAGIMTMAPFTGDKNAVRASFRKAAGALQKLRSRFPGHEWPCLSMGMSNDFETAIEEGSTLIRIGTILFGERKTADGI